MPTANTPPDRHLTDWRAHEPSLTQVREGNALTVAEAMFRLLTQGPDALSLDSRVLGLGPPARRIDLAQLRTLLLNGASDEVKDAAWADLVRRARTGDPAWVVGCVGVAMPGLKNVVARVLRTAPDRHADDIVSELLTEFVDQLHRVDLNRRNIAPRLLLWARKGALRVRGRESRLVPMDPDEIPTVPTACEAGPATLLADGVRQRIISDAEATLIAATRLQGTTLAEYARACQEPEERLYKRRERAEARLVTAIHTGQVSAISAGPVSRNGP